MADFELRALDGGEMGVCALTVRAQEARRLPAGHVLAFKSGIETAEYVGAAEAEGLTFSGKELLPP